MIEPPNCLASWVAAPTVGTKIDWDVSEGSENAFFALSCPCGHSELSVISIFQPHFYLSNQVAYGPIGMRCTACGREADVFNPARHGFDAELGHFPPDNDWAESREEFACPSCGKLSFRLTLVLEYPREVVASASSLALAGRSRFQSREQDFFAYFTLVGSCASCVATVTIASVECA
jgi:hypothetical protein